MRHLITYIISSIISYTVCFGQLFPTDSNYFGDFEDGSMSGWYRNNQQEFSISTNEVFNGQNALKINTSSGCLMFNGAAADFNKTSGTTYSLGFYLKGTPGNSITVSLKNAGSTGDEIQETQIIEKLGWSYYRFKLLSQSDSSTGKVKIKFNNSGIYYIDVIALQEADFNTWFLHPNGTNNTNGDNGLSQSKPLKTFAYAINTAWQKGDLIYVMQGEFSNYNYGNGELNNPPVVNFDNFSGDSDLYNPLVIKNMQGDSPVVKFDGKGGFNGNINHLEISGIEIIGPNQEINYQTAMSNRLIQDNYFTGRGIAIWEGHHININNCKIHDCPNSGIRVNNGDYCLISNNEVYNNTWWSANAESGIVFATVKAIDNFSFTKMRITDNLVYNNINKIPFYSKSNGCTGTGYGCIDYNKIQDGMGCYITRNNQVPDKFGNVNPNGLYNGQFIIANNVAYGNGVNGVVVHKTDNVVVTNNTIYRNGEVPVTIDPNDSEEWKRNLSSGRQGWSGLTINNSSYIKIYNNVISARLDTDNAFRVVFDPDEYTPQNINKRNNIISKGNCQNYCNYYINSQEFSAFPYADPMFKNLNLEALDLSLEGSSSLIDAGHTHNNLPIFDINGDLRVNGTVDIGAYEYYEPLDDQTNDLVLQKINPIYPNPFNNKVVINDDSVNRIVVYDISGRKLLSINELSTELYLGFLKRGTYIFELHKKQSITSYKIVKH